MNDQKDKQKIQMTRMYKINKIDDPIFIDKKPIRWKCFSLW
jgi:hypothetical protein